MLDEWITAVKDELGIDLDVDTGLLLDLARDAAHGVARPAAPLTTFLVGYAAAPGRAEAREAVAEATRKAVALALPLGRGGGGRRRNTGRGPRQPPGRRMTARSDLDDLGAEEALALVNQGNGSGRQGRRADARGLRGTGPHRGAASTTWTPTPTVPAPTRRATPDPAA